MDDEGLVRTLKKRGYVIGRGAVHDDGMMLWLINDVFMFRRGAVNQANVVASHESSPIRECPPAAPALE